MLQQICHTHSHFPLFTEQRVSYTVTFDCLQKNVCPQKSMVRQNYKCRCENIRTKVWCCKYASR